MIIVMCYAPCYLTIGLHAYLGKKKMNASRYAVDNLLIPDMYRELRLVKIPLFNDALIG